VHVARISVMERGRASGGAGADQPATAAAVDALVAVYGDDACVTACCDGGAGGAVFGRRIAVAVTRRLRGEPVVRLRVDVDGGARPPVALREVEVVATAAAVAAAGYRRADLAAASRIAFDAVVGGADADDGGDVAALAFAAVAAAGDAVVDRLGEHGGDGAHDDAATSEAAIAAAAASAASALTARMVLIDHMRDERRYLACVAAWAAETGVAARLLRAGHLIVLVVAGEQASCRAYMRAHRTRPVDVDSKGRACTEKCVHT